MSPHRWKAAAGWAAAVHLGIALIYSSHLHVEHFIPAWLEWPMRIYGNYSGAHTHFNFFAPVVVSQVRVNFRLGQPDGSVRDVQIASSNVEVNQRLAMMLNFYLRPNAREPVVQAWAHYMLETHPEAQWVQTRVELLDIPTLAEVRAGKKAQWVEIGRHGAVRKDGALR